MLVQGFHHERMPTHTSAHLHEGALFRSAYFANPRHLHPQHQARQVSSQEYVTASAQYVQWATAMVVPLQGFFDLIF